MSAAMLVSLAWIGLACLSAAAAPPSSAMTSPELSPPDALPKSKQSTTTFRCTGYYKSQACVSTLYLNNCKHSIKIEWNPLRIPGNKEWARVHRNWCSVTYTSAEYVEERRLKPEKCDGLMRLLAAGLQGFPEVPWQDAQCTHIGTSDGILYVTQREVEPGVRKSSDKQQSQEKDPDPRAVRLEDVRSCSLHIDKKHGRYVRCPVLTQNVHSWMRKLLAFVEVGIVIQNELK